MQLEGRKKNLRFGPGINYKGSRFPEKIEFSAPQVDYALIGQGH